ncbi:hypothetical protein OJ996_23220 [Luteolibacter sp. GHJ8]|uniref:DUF1508 domain-containing protein n=1 Tax=Luteolibacter rhizosphaerae TaxID=2989719 RepID=A0ABT3GA48_9BACT|nr:hypothetical protein [Luteolibacter rhizosphaerae]MCW1916517.1 hypothetical protein [Luteolibacter rhizosphaerae]
MSTEYQVQTFSGGEVRFWIERGSSIHLKAVSPHGDPTELTSEDAREIAAALIAAAEQMDVSPKQIL